MARIAKQAAPCVRDAKPLGKPFKEEHTVLLFHLGNHLADGRLRNVKTLGRRAHGARLGNRDKNLQMANRHTPFLLCIPF